MIGFEVKNAVNEILQAALLKASPELINQILADPDLEKHIKRILRVKSLQ